MARRELHALRGHQVDERVVRRGRGGVHRRHDALVGLRAGDRRDVGKGVADRLGLGAHAAGDDDPAVLAQRRADRLERFGLGAVEKTAGVDDDRVGAGVAGASSYPSARSRVRIRSVSTSAFGQPSETKEMRGAGARSAFERSVIRFRIAMGGRDGKARSFFSRSPDSSPRPRAATEISPRGYILVTRC